MKCLVLLTALMAMMLPTTVVSSHQSSCTDAIFSMASCLGYITANSSSPSQQCCTQFANVVRSSSKCLCQVLKGGASYQLGINVDLNQTLALSLPKACHVQTPPASRCYANSSNSYEHGNGSRTIPREDGSLSNGSSRKSSFTLLSFLYVASYITFYT